MINKTFYPTPYYLLEDIFKDVRFKDIKNILEPSAGKGDICDYLLERYKKIFSYSDGIAKEDIDCIEIDNELQATLKGKGYRVVHNNFLTFNTFKKYDLIVMNPPFDNGDKHLLKALDMQKNGGKIICILNAETLKNTYSNTRTELYNKLIELNADITFNDKAFRFAERKTNVEIAIIKIDIPYKDSEFEFIDKLKKENIFESNYDYECTELVKFASENEYIESAVEHYNYDIAIGTEFIKSMQKVNSVLSEELKDLGDKYTQKTFSVKFESNDKNTSYNGYIKAIRYLYWEKLFANEKFTKNLTGNLKQELYKKLNDLKDYDFSLYNIMTIQQELLKNTIKGVEDTILTLFDEFTVKYSYYDQTSKNIHYYNGWTTNKAFKINKKIIMPYNMFDYWSYDKSYEFKGYRISDRFNDIIKVMDYLSGTKTEITENTYKNYIGDYELDLPYFTVKFCKKGTCHITFKDDDLLEKFNLFGSQKKGWLPPEYGRKRYKDMNQKEKDIVKEFSGSEDNYNKILENQKYYLIDSEKLLLTF